MSNTLRPLHDTIIARRADADKVTKGGIIIPENAKEKPIEAVAVAVGPGLMSDSGVRMPMDVKKGDRILIAKAMGADVKINGEDYVVIHEAGVLAVLESE